MSSGDTASRQRRARLVGRSLLRMSVRLRKIVVVLHVISSVSWLGLTIGNLVLTITGLTSDNPTTQHAVYQVMGILGDTLFIPMSVTAFGTGTLLGLFTSWGLFQHRWVAVKFWLTLIAVVLTPLSLLPGIHDAAATVSHTPPDQVADVDASGAISAACVSLTMYTISVVLSIFKPWGRTTLERKNIAGEPTAVAAVRAGVKSG